MCQCEVWGNVWKLSGMYGQRPEFAVVQAHETEDSWQTNKWQLVKEQLITSVVFTNCAEAATVKGLGLLTYKPMIYCANVSENDLADQGAKNQHVQV